MNCPLKINFQFVIVLNCQKSSLIKNGGENEKKNH